MKTAGIIAEYNPLHSGHLYHISATKAAGFDRVAVVMSPNAVQRGEPAFFSKWTRAAAAVRCGADLVLELPTPWAVSSAPRFAEAGVRILSAAGADTLSFGSELGETEPLMRCAEACLEAEKGERILELLSAGLSYAAARDKAVSELCGEETAALLRTPNNILGVEYLKAIRSLELPMEAFTVARLGAAHDSAGLQTETASASALRDTIRREGIEPALRFLPEETGDLFRQDLEAGIGGTSFDRLEPAVLYRLRTMSPDDFRALPDVSEGLEQRLYKASRALMPLDALTEEVRTRRYPLSRVRRIIFSAMLGLTKDSAAGAPPYLRVLAFNDTGREMLRAVKKGPLPVYHSFAKLERDFPDLAKAELMATDLFRMCCPKTPSADGLKALSEYRDRRPFLL
ncbi:MAG: nucleotidyltransferase family protein [Oscillospiraceae bacterium]|nr:nucleotidyltransferase family protein [Oscillospiraceae bacterium]